MKSIVEAVACAAARKPDAVAVIAEGQKISYSELWREVRGFAAYINSFGFEKGTRIVVKAKHSIWYVVACFGIQLSGCANVPVEKMIGIEGLKDIAQKLSAAMVISDMHLSKAAYETVDSASVRELATKYFEETMEFGFPQSEDVCDILFTTGTTGNPKGVVLSHRAVIAVAENLQYGLEPGAFDNNVYLIPSPINHAGGIRNLYVCMVTGTTAVLLDGFSNVKLFFQCIRDYDVTSIYMPPSAVRMMVLLAAKEFAKHTEQLRFIFTSSAMFPESDKERLREILPRTQLYNDYGCSEAGRTCIFNYSRIEGKENCVGRPTRNSHLFIVDDKGNEMQSSKTNCGLIAISGPIVMSGYYDAPELTQKTLQNGAIYTNDIGYIDEEGYVYVLGRRDDVINLGGLKIAPTEVENVALRYPGIAECVCFPVEDKISGIAPKMNIIEATGIEVDISKLREYMLKTLEAYKVPKLIEKVKEIPKTANGKIDRKVLK